MRKIKGKRKMEDTRIRKKRMIIIIIITKLEGETERETKHNFL